MFLPRIVNIRPRTVQGAPLATGRIPCPDHLQAEQRRRFEFAYTPRIPQISIKSPQSQKTIHNGVLLYYITNNMFQTKFLPIVQSICMQLPHSQMIPKCWFHDKKLIQNPLPLAVGSSSWQPRCSPGLC